MVDDECAGQAGSIEHVGRVDVLHVERRVLAHQDHVEVAERDVFTVAELVPAVVIVTDPDARRAPPGGAG